MNYYPHGPFEIPKTAKNRIDTSKNAIVDFWAAVEKDKKGLADAVGCYVFSIRAGRGLLPWYIGMAEKQTFRKECFANHKLINYNETIAARKGTPVLTLVPKFTTTGRFARRGKNGHSDIQFLEKMLIGLAVRRNANLVNIKNTRLLKEMIVPGILNNPKGRNKLPVKNFKSLMGV